VGRRNRKHETPFVLLLIGGGLIHILLVIAVIVLVYNIFMGRRRGV
jgi:hypothetical protein